MKSYIELGRFFDPQATRNIALGGTLVLAHLLAACSTQVPLGGRVQPSNDPATYRCPTAQDRQDFQEGEDPDVSNASRVAQRTMQGSPPDCSP